jgi:hypothetical protein
MNSSAAINPSTPCDEALAIWFDQHKTYIRAGRRKGRTSNM